VLSACLTVPAVAAMVASGTGSAGAVPVSPASIQRTGGFSPFGLLGCNPVQLEQWNLNSGRNRNTVVLTYHGGTYRYSINLTQEGSCLSGSLTDAGYPVSGPISGTVSGNAVTFTFSYPRHSIQGTRTFAGTISSGAVSGTWSESGTERGSGSWTLANSAVPACHRPDRRGCPVS
jgi:hypothetical protein